MKRLGVAITAAVLLSSGAAMATETDSFTLTFSSWASQPATFVGNASISFTVNADQVGASVSQYAAYLSTAFSLSGIPGVASDTGWSLVPTGVTAPNFAIDPNWGAYDNLISKTGPAVTIYGLLFQASNGDQVGVNYDTSRSAYQLTDGTSYSEMDLTSIKSTCLEGCTVSNGGNPPPVPEPITIAVLGTALVGFGVARRKAA